MRIEAQGKYMQSILERACQTLAGDNNNMASARVSQGFIDMQGAMKDAGSPMSFPLLQDLHIYGGDQVVMQQQLDRPLANGFFPTNNTLCLGNKRPMTWAQAEPSKSDGGVDMVPMADEKKFEGSLKLERPSPRRAALTMGRMNPIMSNGALNQTRNLSYG